ncbi:MAG: hypothetical protein H6Q15_2006 [Bacteroidetes bacterium]|nr:hypothetical protein [Bacteroidota bacterium]
MPKKFIQQVLIKEIDEIHKDHPYIAFCIMAIGIEFLGKCLNKYDDWNKSGRSKNDFELAVNNLDSLEPYRNLLVTHKLWDSLRNGFAHSFVPKGTLTLSSDKEDPHLTKRSETIINLKCEDFYNDFKNACEEVVKMDTFISKKMNYPLLFMLPAVEN